VPSVQSGTIGLIDLWSTFQTIPETDEAEKIKTVVFPKDYKAVEVEDGKTFYLGKNLSHSEQVEYVGLLKEFPNVHAWEPSDLRGISPALGEHHIDLIEGTTIIQTTPTWAKSKILVARR
jgi:hypothetical protein